MLDITVLSVQRKIKPQIEDVLPYYLDGQALTDALDFVASLRSDKLNLTWAGIHNAWKAAYKGKPILYIRLNYQWWNGNQTAKWTVTPYLVNIRYYENDIIANGLQDCVWNGLWRCKVFANGEPCGNGCAPGVDKTFLGKRINHLCNGNFYAGRNWIWFYDPDEMTINCVKKLLELEKRARAEKKMAEIIKTYKERLPGLRFIGKRYSNADRNNGDFGAKWDEWFREGWFETLKEHGETKAIESDYLGLTRCNERDMENTFEYWIGMFFPPDTVVPEGFDFIDLAESYVAVCWIKGREDDGSIFSMHDSCMAKFQNVGMRHFKRDDGQRVCLFERYNHPRFTEKDERGHVILDYGIYLDE